ncbi:MAG: hypothetical protein NTX30_13525, partial [Deltaproteobacteria bacterium]|nr:hypothetical protein [Deltaproteobacteria bacterium]
MDAEKSKKRVSNPRTNPKKMNLPYSRVLVLQIYLRNLRLSASQKFFYFNQGGSWNFAPARLWGQTILLLPSTI